LGLPDAEEAGGLNGGRAVFHAALRSCIIGHCGRRMIKLSVMYPNGDGATFDMEYYCKSHIPLVRESVGASLKDVVVDQGIGEPESPAPFLAMGHLMFDSLEELQSALDVHGPKLMADIPNYTNTRPTIQISEIKL
jgi:uncharacterized protein (TIGR02118 family)